MNTQTCRRWKIRTVTAMTITVRTTTMKKMRTTTKKKVDDDDKEDEDDDVEIFMTMVACCAQLPGHCPRLDS